MGPSSVAFRRKEVCVEKSESLTGDNGNFV